MKMSKAARSVQVFSFYLLAIGLGFLIMPNVVLKIFGLPETSEPWIRVMAMLLLFLSYYYLRASQHELRPFLEATVHVRSSVIVFFIAFVMLRIAPPVLLLFAVIDLAAAAWTYMALRTEKEEMQTYAG